MSGRGAAGRGRGGKFKKFTRGGGHHFSRNLAPLDADGNEISMWSKDAVRKGDEDSSEEDSDEESEEESSEDEKPSTSAQPELTREERRKAKKAQKDAAIAKKKGPVQVGDLPTDSEEEDEDDDMPANPNHSKAARKQLQAPVPEEDAAVKEVTKGVSKVSVDNMSRKEREALQAQQAKERYQKLHLEGKTDEAQSDMARLKLIRAERAAAAARKQAEKEELEEQQAAKKTEIEAREAKRREAALGKPAKKKGSKK